VALKVVSLVPVGEVLSITAETPLGWEPGNVELWATPLGEEARIAELEARCAEFKRLGQQFERDSRSYFEQSCKNLERAEKAERERDEYKTRLATASLLLRSTPSEQAEILRALEPKP
jgi:hypothetical protein